MFDPRFVGVPLAIEPVAARRLLTIEAMSAPAPVDDSPIVNRVGSVAVIAVHGVLMQRTIAEDGNVYALGYDLIRSAFLGVIGDKRVKGIVLDVDSPGGEVAGCFDLADLIYSCRGTKPIAAICTEHAYSAAYAIASAADHVIVPRTGGVGSIGVITAIIDQSAALERAGLAVHFVTYGEKKAAESRAAMTGVTDDVLASVQADVDEMGKLFCATVARHRGLDVEAVRGMEAACYLGRRGVAAGLADHVAAPDVAFRAFAADCAA